MVLLVRSLCFKAVAVGVVLLVRKEREGGGTGGTAEGTNPLTGSFYGNCREWLGNHTSSIVCRMGNHSDV